VAAITAVAAGLRLHALGAKSFWMDEGVTAACLRLDWYNFLRLLWRREANMALYYVLLRGWARFGHSEAWLRGFSVLAAAATVPVLYGLGKRLFGAAAAVMGALLLAVNAYHVRYAQEARSYSLAVFLVTLAAFFLAGAVERGRRGCWKGYAAAVILAIYTHFFSALVVIAHWIALRALPERPVSAENPALLDGPPELAAARSGFTKAVKHIALWTLPVWVFIAATGAGPLRWLRRPGLGELHGFLEQFAGNGGTPLLGLYLAGGVLAAMAGVQTWRRYGRSFQLWGYALALSWAVAPVLIVLAVTPIRPLFLPRYLQVCLPAFVLCVAAGLAPPAALPYPRLAARLWRWAAWPVMGLIVWFALGGVRAYYARDFDIGRQDYRHASEHVLEAAEAGDAIIFYPSYGRCAYQYYADHSTGSGFQPMIIAPGYGDRMSWRDFTAKVSPPALNREMLDYRRVWVVLANDGPQAGDPLSRQVQAVLAGRYRLAETRTFPGIKVELYAP
jgi:4-amino-4-deoxy-L-arabinose transferase-like glycosyltransferase